MSIGVILGSGLSDFRDELENPQVIYSEKGGVHAKTVVKGKILGKKVYVFTGRNHFYETNSANRIFTNVNLAKKLKINFLVITNAAGGINKNYNISDFMFIKSYINFIRRPMTITNFKLESSLLEWAYDLAYNELIPVHLGNYLATSGPVYETPSEISFLKKIKVDAAGMSTIPEILKASEFGINTLAISCITNILSVNPTTSVSHNEVIKIGKRSYPNFSKLLKLIISDY